MLIDLGIRVLITAYLWTGWQELALEEINTQDQQTEDMTFTSVAGIFQSTRGLQEQKTGSSFSA